ncbi:MAG: DUF1284 domain-containing protein [Oscillospiraceae bacterium]|nr:DUF1284 domain-containing protein [Oscillospiraceae bacterium]
MSVLKIRPHHGLCTEFFEGKGYSDSFTENMYNVISLLEKNPEVKIIIDTDDICSGCPENIDNRCISFKKVKDYDKKVLEYCKISENDMIYWKDFKTKIKSEILEKNLLKDICSNCRWYKICEKNADSK